MVKGISGREPKIFNKAVSWIEDGGEGTAEQCADEIWGEATHETMQSWRVLNVRLKKYFRAKNIVWGLVKVDSYPGVYKKIGNYEDAYRMLDYSQLNVLGRTVEAIEVLKKTAETYPQVLKLIQPQAQTMMDSWTRTYVALSDLSIKNKGE